MESCPNCHQSIPEDSTDCPHCGRNLEHYRNLLLPRDSTAPRRETPRFETVPGGPSSTSSRIVVVVIGLVVLGLVVNSLLPRHFPTLELERSASNPDKHDPCVGRSRCLVAYLAPWCPHCRSSIGVVKSLIDRFHDSRTVGVKVILGMDERDALESMAKEIGAQTYLDPDRKLWYALGIDGVPHYFLYDEANKILNELAGGASPPALLQHFGLSSEK